MTPLFNKVIQTSTLSDIWKEANVSSIKNKGSRKDIKKKYATCENRGLLTRRNSGYKKKKIQQ